MKTPLYGHTSEATAYVVNDYPYSGMRCQIKFWLESDPKKGMRFVSQTQNPKTGRWNNPKKSTYCFLAMGMYLDEKGHCVHDALHQYSKAKEILEFVQTFSTGYDAGKLLYWCLAKKKLAGKIAEGQSIFSINGVPQKPSEEDQSRARVEMQEWEACASFLAAQLKA